MCLIIFQKGRNKKSVKTDQSNFMNYRAICTTKKLKKREIKRIKKKKIAKERRHRLRGNLVRSYFVLC